MKQKLSSLKFLKSNPFYHAFCILNSLCSVKHRNINLYQYPNQYTLCYTLNNFCKQTSSNKKSISDFENLQFTLILVNFKQTYI